MSENCKDITQCYVKKLFDYHEDGYLIWKGGIWKYGVWRGKVWEDGKMWSNIKQKFVRVKQINGEFVEKK